MCHTLVVVLITYEEQKQLFGAYKRHVALPVKLAHISQVGRPSCDLVGPAAENLITFSFYREEMKQTQA